MGGALTLGALAASDDIVAGAPFYGVNFGLFDAKKLKKPVQGHFGALDAMEGFSDPATGKRLEKELTNAKVFIYEGVGHAFMNPEPAPFASFEERREKMGFPAYDMRQADLAWGRLLDFFLEHPRRRRRGGRTSRFTRPRRRTSVCVAATCSARRGKDAHTGKNWASSPAQVSTTPAPPGAARSQQPGASRDGIQGASRGLPRGRVREDPERRVQRPRPDRHDSKRRRGPSRAPRRP